MKLGNENIALHDKEWDAEHPRPVLVQGESRDFAHIVSGALDGTVSSPPYADKTVGGGDRIAWDKAKGEEGTGKRTHGRGAIGDGYGSTPGNLGNLREGTLDGAVSSPPYAAIAPGQGGLNTLPPREGHDDQTGRAAGPSQRITGIVSSPPYAESLQNPGGGRLEDGFGAGRSTPGKPCGPHSQLAQTAYGSTPGQLGELPAGTLDGIAASPPFEAGLGHGEKETERKEYFNRVAGASGTDYGNYGETRGNIGNDRGETFWSAARVILDQCALAVKPGGVTAWVVKAFVRKGKLVDFPGDWARLLEMCGFEVFLRCRAWVVSQDAQADIFGGETRKQRKSFFRRLAEAKGSPAIDFEQVIWARRVEGLRQTKPTPGAAMPLFQPPRP